MTVKSAVRQKTAESILSPKGVPFSAAGKNYTILPMKERQLLIIGNTLSLIVDNLSMFLIAAENYDVDEYGNFVYELDSEGLPIVDAAGNYTRKRKKANPADMITILPNLIKVILPQSTELIAASLKEEESFIADEFTTAERLDALCTIRNTCNRSICISGISSSGNL